MSSFDDTFYFQQCAGAFERAREQFHGSALLDYFWVGCLERRSPSDCFDEEYYLRSNPDVAAALEASEFLCGYHHYLKSGRGEGRRGVAPEQCCIVDARHASRPGDTVMALVSAIQHARPRWRVVGAAAWEPMPGAALHRWAAWLRVPADPERANALLAAERPAYIVCLDQPVEALPDGAVAVAAVEADAGLGGRRQLVDAVAPVRSAEIRDAAGLTIVAERLASALESAEQVKRSSQPSRLDCTGPGGAIGLGVTIVLGAGDGERVVTVAVDLPADAGVARETLVLEAGEPVVLELAVGRPTRTVVRLAAGPTRVTIRPSKAGHRARSRVVLARVEAAPVDLVTPPDRSATADLTLIDLNTDLARAKRELGRFLTKADALMAARPALEFTVPPAPRLAPVVIPRCLIVCGLDAERSWAGRDTVDVAAWREYLDARGFAVDLIELPPETASDVGRLRKRELVDHRFIVLAGPRAPGLLTDGLEFGRHLVRLYRGGASGGRAVEARSRAADLACARAADRLIVDGPADAAYYRAAGVPAGRIDYVPSFLPAAFRGPARPYSSRPRQLLVHVDTSALLDGRIRRSRLGRDMLGRLARSGWRLTISVSPRLRARAIDDLDLDGLEPSPTWCDPASGLPDVLRSTRLVLVPGLELPDIGGLVAAARIIGFQVLLDGRGQGHAGGGGHFVGSAGLVVPELLDELDRDPGGIDQDRVRDEAFRSLDRVLGFRSAGWQEGRGDRSADI